MTTLGSWLKGQGFTVDDNNVPYGRESTWRGVDFLMVHHTVSDCDGSEQSMADYCRYGGSGTYPPLCQIMLGHSGKVWMTCKERSGQADPGRASHAGSGSGYGIPNDTMNERCLGIECQCDGTHKIATHTTQYTALIRLLAALCRKYDVPVKNVIGHKEWSSTGKVDPKDDMNVIRADVEYELGGGGSGAPYVTKDVYRSKCGYGEPTNGDDSSDTVKELQERLNRISLQGGQTLAITGRYDTDTDEEVRLWQQQVCNDPPDPVNKSYLGPNQFAFMFSDSVYARHDDGDPAIASGTTPPPDPEEPVTAGGNYWYSGKPSGTLVIGDAYKKLDVDTWAPSKDCIILGMLYLNVKLVGASEGEFKVRLIRDPDDATAYQTFYAKSGDSFLLTHVWFESAEAGRKLWWEVGCADSGYTLELGTRYAKFAVIA